MKVVFLDIDGVLQPYGSYYRFNDLSVKLIEDISKKKKIDYSKYSVYDVSSVYYDWDEQAVARLKYVLDSTNSKIIVSSDWRSKEHLYKMRDLLMIHDLGNYWYADNDILNVSSNLEERRALEIKDSLDRYEISNYVVLDDMKGLEYYYPNNSVITYDKMSIDDMKKCIKILKK